jgi:predicted nucleic acid-binding protein
VRRKPHAPASSFIDAYHVILMQQVGLNQTVSFHKQLDRVSGVTRIEPNED